MLPAFSVIVKTKCETDEFSAALIMLPPELCDVEEGRLVRAVHVPAGLRHCEHHVPATAAHHVQRDVLLQHGNMDIVARTAVILWFWAGGEVVLKV